MHRFIALAFTLSLSLSALPQAATTGRYPNLFAEAGHSDAAIRARLASTYAQLFHGDPQTQSLYFKAGSNSNGPLAYITDWANHDVRTEGVSYGMMISVQLDHKAEFDALWNWARTNMFLGDPKHPAAGYFAWSCKTDGTPNEETPAPDGEEYFVMALYFASARWGDGPGIYNYRAEADTLLRTMRHHPQSTGPTRFGTRDVAAEVDEEHRMIRFVPGSFGRDFTDPSYHLPGFYELWARWGPPEDRAFWTEAAQASRAFFSRTANAATGLSPAYSNFDGTPHPTKFPQSGDFGYDSWRSAGNWSWDYTWWHEDPAAPARSNRLLAFFTAQGPNYGEVYTLDGHVLSPHHAPGLVAANAVAALAASDRVLARPFVEALWSQPVPSGQGRYYDGMLTLLALLHVSGNFRIYTPAWAPTTTLAAKPSSSHL